MAKIENSVEKQPVEAVINQASLEEITQPSEKVEVDKNILENLLIEVQNLKNQVNSTTDQNKLRAFEDSKKELDKFAFSVKLFPMADYDCPVISWKTISNFVDTSKEEIQAQQIIEITFIKQDGKEDKKQIELIHFATFLKRTDPIESKSLKNLDGTDVAVFKQLNPETKVEYYVMGPKANTYNVTLDVNGKELTILSTYLNA